MKRFLLLLLCLSFWGCPESPTKPELTCFYPPAQQESDAAFMIQRYALSGVSRCDGPYATGACGEVVEILSALSAVNGIHGNVFVFDGGQAIGFNAYALPTRKIIVHEDALRGSFAIATAYEAYYLGLPIPGIGAPRNGLTGFRNLVTDMIRAIVTAGDLQRYSGYYPWLPQTDFGRKLAKQVLAGLAAHEMAHLHNGDAEARYCAGALSGGNQWIVGAYAYDQEKQADITGAGFIAEGYLADPDGLIQPAGMMLTMEVMIAMDRLTGGSPTYPSALERLSNIRTVFSRRAVPSTLMFY